MAGRAEIDEQARLFREPPQMRAFEFNAQPRPDGSIQLPPSIACQVVDPTQPVKVIILLPDDEERARVKAGMDQFAKGYAPTDNIYDDLRRQ